MASVKVVLRKKANKDGTFPLALRITKDRRTSFIHLGYNINEKDWNSKEQTVRKSHPNSTRLNNFILAKRTDASDKSLDAETQQSVVSSFAIKKKIKPVAGATFFAQADLYLKRLLAAGNYNVHSAEKPRIKHFREFLNGGDIAFSDITVGLLERYKAFLQSYHLARQKHSSDNDEKTRPNKPMSERTIVNHWVCIRSIFSQAIKEKATDKKYYPFGKEGVTIKFPETTKVGISKEDIEKLENVKLTSATHDHARDLWLLSFYFAGMRISDILRLRWSDFQDMRLNYQMGKNKKTGSLKTPEKAIRILEKYEHLKEREDDFIFPHLKNLPDQNNDLAVKRRIASTANRFGKILRQYVAPKAKIKGKLTLHVSRHSFATLAGDKIPLQMLQKLYRHSDIRTTIGYQASFIHKDADEALDEVLGTVRPKKRR